MIPAMFEYQSPNPSFVDKLERKFGWLAIPRLPLYILGGQAFLTAFGLQIPEIGNYLYLDPFLATHGEWWRFFTFLIIPSTTPLGLTLAIFWFSFFWFVCQSLEAQWGPFKTSLYILIGWLGQVLVSMSAWLIWGVPFPQAGHYLFLSLQLAFAWYFPEYVTYIYFVLPVKMRYVAWFNMAYLVYRATVHWPGETFVIVGSMINYLLFFTVDHAKGIKALQQSSEARAHFHRKLNEAKVTAREKKCEKCERNPNTADIRLCTCAKCGEDGKFWCTEDLAAHLGR
jgi:hypothetical protein